MTILELNNELTPVESRNSSQSRQAVLNATLRDGSLSVNWTEKTTTIKEKLFMSNLPDEAAMFHTNYLTYLARTYSTHHKIVLSPDIIWYTIMCDVAQHVVKNSEQHRSLFTKAPEGKIDLIVPCVSETEPLRMDSIYGLLLKTVPIECETFLPRFTTTTESSRLAVLAAFLETCSPYYDYMMMLCGHPAVKVLGTKEDWDLLIDRLGKFVELFAKVGSELQTHIANTALPTAWKIRQALDSDESDWFKQIFTETRCGSGGETNVDGWFSRLMMVQPKGIRKTCNFPTHITCVPYKTLPSNTEWRLCFGLFSSDLDEDGFMIPEFSWVQNIKLKETEVLVWNKQ